MPVSGIKHNSAFCGLSSLTIQDNSVSRDTMRLGYATSHVLLYLSLTTLLNLSSHDNQLHPWSRVQAENAGCGGLTKPDMNIQSILTMIQLEPDIRNWCMFNKTNPFKSYYGHFNKTNPIKSYGHFFKVKMTKNTLSRPYTGGQLRATLTM